MDKLCQAIGFAVYSKRAVYDACLRLNAINLDSSLTAPASLTFNQFNTYWQLMTTDCHDEASRFIYTLAAAATGERKPRNYLVHDDFVPILLDLIHTYPGLSFLVNSTQFHSKYCEVVIVRIFWNVNRSWTGRITAHELRKSDFLSTLHLLETVADINKVTDYFSYEHFYVAYCRFWELDTDHDMVINREDMRQHCNGAITDVIIDRVFSGAVMRNIPKLHVKGKGPCRAQQIETIGFEDFVAFLLAEEDKKHPTSIEYWFR
jgi:serine/threonine-protein phosphatase 2A regulatory subunit B''